MATATVTSPSDIHTAMLDSPSTITPNSASDYPYHQILPNEIKGLDTFSATFTATHTIQPLPLSNTIRIFFFYRGTATITTTANSETDQQQQQQQYAIDDMTLFIPNPLHPLTITTTSTTTPLRALLLHWHLTPADTPNQHTTPTTPTLPYIQPYTTARTYKEAIKSHKTTSRTLLPPAIIPRLAIGSVQTVGPDRVAAHRHAMLEQLFMGVRGCKCTVECDGVEQSLVDGCVLHIPLGSMHGVGVVEGEVLEYLWFDFFLNQEDGNQWIATMHKDDP